MDTQLLLIALTAFAGGMAAALLGWLDSQEAFNPGKMGASFIRALLAGGLFALGYQAMAGPSSMDYLYAFLAGAGVDVLGKRGLAVLRRPSGGE